MNPCHGARSGSDAIGIAAHGAPRGVLDAVATHPYASATAPHLGTALGTLDRKHEP